MILALFDFDNTVTHHDSFMDFLKFASSPKRLRRGLANVAPLYTLYRLRLWSLSHVKEMLISACLKGWTQAEFKSVAERYSRTRLPDLVRPSMMDEIRRHQALGHRVVIVTGSVQEWLEGWCATQKVELIATRVQIRDGVLTGKFDGRDCVGQAKVRRIKEIVNMEEVEYIYAYGDSRHDKPMLKLADEAHWVTKENPH